LAGKPDIKQRHEDRHSQCNKDSVATHASDTILNRVRVESGVQYNQYCSEENYTPLSTRTLFRIVSEACVASVRKSLQGLDSYAVEGGRGFGDPLSLLDTLVQYGANEAAITELKENLRHLKQYIKSDYKVKERCQYRVCLLIV